jgi:hypothetical protein
MTIVIHGQAFDLRFEENIPLIPQLVQKLAAEAAQDASPAGNGSAQPSKLAPLALAFRQTA